MRAASSVSYGIEARPAEGGPESRGVDGDDGSKAGYRVVSVDDLFVTFPRDLVEYHRPSILPIDLCEDEGVIKTAYLRVYTPEVAGGDDPVPGFVRSYGLLSETEGDGDWAVDWDGRRLVCPRNLRLRVLESTVAFANAFRGMGAGLIPEEAARSADQELRRYREEYPSHRSHVLTSTWHVPVRWFTAFVSDDKELYQIDGLARLRYRVDLVLARERVEHALEVLRGLQIFQGPAEELGQLSEWLELFPDESMLELDYSDVSELFDPQDLVFDESVDLVQQSVNALAEGDMLTAGENYGRVVSRWAPAFSVTFSN